MGKLAFKGEVTGVEELPGFRILKYVSFSRGFTFLKNFIFIVNIQQCVIPFSNIQE